jgi:NIMA (never in mitosis gene a)-related kinase
MEYAEGGNLADKIKAARYKNQYFDTDAILNWISQIILGVMLMHSKNILHRDLKCQNLFLTKEGVLKIGDFGISKELETMSKLAETNVGTPYFMAPEVCKGELYGEKADVWAIGCILYELAILKKPFDADSISGVFDKIIHKPIDLSGDDVDTDIRMLIFATLDKDPSKRPSIWELSSIPCINDRINNFIKENKCEDSVNCVFERRNNQEETKDGDASGTPFYSVFDINKLDVLAHLIRSDIPMEETKAGWLQQPEKCATGYDIIKWIKDHVEKDDRKAEEIGQKMLDQDIIFRVDKSEVFQGGHTVLYKFYEDRADIASNLLRPWKGDVGNALDVSAELVGLIEEIYTEAIFEGEESMEIHSEEALKSSKYDRFVTNIAQLELVDLNFGTFNEGL